MTADEQRAQLLERARRHERQLQSAVADLNGAVRRPFELPDRLRERVGANPLPWTISALLIGFWLGSRRGEQEES